MTSLVDVIFLLLLFFMLSSTFARFAEIELSAASGGVFGDPIGGARFLLLGEDRILLDGREIAIDALTSSLQEETIIISLRGDVNAQRMIDLLGALRKAPGVTFSVLQ